MATDGRADETVDEAFETAQMLERLVTMTYALGDARQLRASQWAALRFFKAAGPYARTVKAFAEHNCTSTASASQTVSTLVRRGLLTSAASRHDGRSKEVVVTREGARFLERDPLRHLSGSLDVLDPEAKSTLYAAVAETLRTLDGTPHQGGVDNPLETRAPKRAGAAD